MVLNKKGNSHQPIVNRRARFDYDLGDQVILGMVLSGQQTRAARDGHVQLKGAYVNIKDGELWLNNASFSIKPNERGLASRVIDDKPKKLLASRKQIDKFQANRQAGLAIVPTKLINTGRYIKLVVSTGRGLKKYDKREVIKKRDQQREIDRGIKT